MTWPWKVPSKIPIWASWPYVHPEIHILNFFQTLPRQIRQGWVFTWAKTVHQKEKESKRSPCWGLHARRAQGGMQPPSTPQPHGGRRCPCFEKAKKCRVTIVKTVLQFTPAQWDECQLWSGSLKFGVNSNWGFSDYLTRNLENFQKNK